MSFRISANVPVPLDAGNGANGCLGYTRWVATANSSGDIVGRRLEMLVWNAAGAVDANDVVAISQTDVAIKNPKLIDAAAVAVDQSVLLAVAPVAIADATVGWVAIEGEVYANVDGDTTDVAIGDYLKVTVATNPDAFLSDGTTKTLDSAAIALEANASTEAVKLVKLLGFPVDVD